MSRPPNFDRLARPYRWLEYLTFGPALERCRFHFLPELANARKALVLGDGDGRFLEKLLRKNPGLQADVVDISPAMLEQLSRRLTPEMHANVTLICTDMREFLPFSQEYDLIITHFSLDCLFQTELNSLVSRIRPRVAPGGAIWVVSEFAYPSGRARGLAGKLLISLLYQSFGWLTGLRVRALPDHEAPLRNAGFICERERSWLGGLLVSQLWHTTYNA